jgi:hypothetical protein
MAHSIVPTRFLPASFRIVVAVMRVTLVLACALAAGCASSGEPVRSQVADATRAGCDQRAALDDPLEATRDFPGAFRLHLGVASGALIQRGSVVSALGDVAIDDAHVWVSVPQGQLVLGFDPHRRVEDVRFHLSATPVVLTAGGGRLWVAARTVEGQPGRLLRVDAGSGEQTGHAAIGPYPTDVAYGGGAAWVADGGDALYRVDAETLAVHRTPLVGAAIAVAVGGDTVWAATNRGDLVGVDAATGRIRRMIDLKSTCGPVALAVSGHVVWVALNFLDAVEPVDVESGDVGHPILVGDGPEGLAIGGGDLWVTTRRSFSVNRVDLERRRVTGSWNVGVLPQGIVANDDGVWVLDVGLGRLTLLPLAR